MKISVLCISALATAGFLLPGHMEVHAAQTINMNRAILRPDTSRTVKAPPSSVAPPKGNNLNRGVVFPSKGLQFIPGRIPPRGTTSPSGSSTPPAGDATSGAGSTPVASEPGKFYVPTLKVIGLPGGPPPDKPATGPFSPFTATVPTLKVIGLPGGPPPDKPATGPFSPKVITVTTLKVIGK
ncbi:MAG: hypothetical protein HGB00_06915 [Chlorobiaceae bacterium]|nr:hypothetical protein [Chlorobiaceae bacterium]